MQTEALDEFRDAVECAAAVLEALAAKLEEMGLTLSPDIVA